MQASLPQLALTCNGVFCVWASQVNGGELFSRLVERKSFNEKDARAIMRILLQGLEHIHSKNIVRTAALISSQLLRIGHACSHAFFRRQTYR